MMSALLDNGLDVTALHNHFFCEEPRIFYMHVHGMGTAEDLARRVQSGVRGIDRAARPLAPIAARSAGDWAACRRSATGGRSSGTRGEQNGPVLQGHASAGPTSTCARMVQRSTSRMGLNTWAAFAGTDARRDRCG